MNIYEKLSEIQAELKAPKNQFNSFGNYHYRNCEDILEAVKPICKKHKAALLLTDNIESIEGRHYVKATATLIDCVGDNQSISVCAYAREEEAKKGMDGSQVTGASSSYARKYALNGLFNIDDTKDSDTTNKHGKDDKAKSDGAKKTEQKTSSQFAAPKQEMTLEEARAFQTKNGTYFDDLSDDRLEYIVSNAKNPQSILAAKLILHERDAQHDLKPLDEGDLPF